MLVSQQVSESRKEELGNYKNPAGYAETGDTCPPTIISEQICDTWVWEGERKYKLKRVTDVCQQLSAIISTWVWEGVRKYKLKWATYVCQQLSARRHKSANTYQQAYNAGGRTQRLRRTAYTWLHFGQTDALRSLPDASESTQRTKNHIGKRSAGVAFSQACSHDCWEHGQGYFQQIGQRQVHKEDQQEHVYGIDFIAQLPDNTPILSGAGFLPGDAGSMGN
ncbi:hypothetical protein EDD15DRAFT_2198459 [Pisolithus albus]|nr:hypothetical protein EDD15DRAFT_2198459 [Pisolithus albus]